jgi:putative ABC transport system permease protein
VPDEPVLGSARGDVPVDVVATAETFPGKNSTDPLLITTRATFDDLLGDIGTAFSSRQAELWAKGDADRVQSVLQQRGVSFFSVTSTEIALGSPSLQSTLWTLGLLGALGAASGLAGVAGLLLYMQARHRSALISAAMTRRMRLARRTELTAWLLEVGASMGTAFLLAVGVGLGVAALMHERLDLRPSLPPAPIMVVPVWVILGAGLAVCVLVLLAAVRLQREVDGANVAEVLRT